ncbi:MAG: cbb3-type cytochrome c oxidase subunit I [Anaerolineales bacterium]
MRCALKAAAGLFGWLRLYPMGRTGLCRVGRFHGHVGWIGGVTGVVIGTEQINLLVHNTLRLPGHFHATVVSGTTTAFMGFTYYVIPLIFRKELKLKKWAVWQPYVFGGGMLLVSLGMIVSGLQALRAATGISPSPRRPWHHRIIACRLWYRRDHRGHRRHYVRHHCADLHPLDPRLEANKLLLVSGDNNPVLESTKLTEHDMESKQNQPRGSFVLVIAFLVWFAVYYLTNWWLLGRTWFIR